MRSLYLPAMEGMKWYLENGYTLYLHKYWNRVTKHWFHYWYGYDSHSGNGDCEILATAEAVKE